MNYQLQFLFLDERFKSCQVHVRDKKKRWIGVMAYIPDHLPIWFAYNKDDGRIKHGRRLHAMQRILPVAYSRVLMNLGIQFDNRSNHGT